LGKYANAGSFDGTDQYVDIGTDSNLRPNNVTVSAWVNLSENDNGDYNGIACVGNGYCLTYYPSTTTWGPNKDYWNFGLRDSADGAWVGIYSNTAASLNIWTHLVGIFDEQGNLKLYVDGVLQDETISATGIEYLDSLSYIGTYTASDYYFPGIIDEVRIYNRTLSSNEVTRLYKWAPGPVAYYKFDEGSGTTNVYDSSGNNNAGTMNGGINESAWTNGRIGGALELDADSSQYISAADDSTLRMNASHSLMAWVHLVDTDNHNFFIEKAASGGDLSNYYLWWNQSTSNITAGFRDSGDTAWEESYYNWTPVANEWYHLATVFDSDADTRQIFVDGVEVLNEAETAEPYTANPEQFLIGAQRNLANFLDAKIDEVRVYNYARTPQQIIQDMNAGHPAPGSPVGSAIGHWKFDEGYGTTANDSTVNNNDLTLNSASWTNSGKFGKAWNGDGGKWLSRSDDPDFDVSSTDDYTISVWFKSDGSGTPTNKEYLVTKYTDFASEGGYGIAINTSGYPTFEIDDDASWDPDDAATVSTDYYDATWHHAVGVKTGTTKIELYIDGILAASDTSILATGSLSNGQPLVIGDSNASDNGDEFTGDIDEVRIYRFALSAAQVGAEYNQGKSLVFGATSTTAGGSAPSYSAGREFCVPGSPDTCNSPVALWRFDEYTGTSAYDTSNNNYTNTITGATWKSGAFCHSGACLELDGNDDYASTSSTLDLSSTDKVSVDFWFKPFVTSQDMILTELSDNYNDYSDSFIIALTNTNKVEVSHYTLAAGYCQWHSNDILSANNWYHIAGTFDKSLSSDECVGYINGITSGSYPNFNNNTSGNFGNRTFYIGARAGESYPTEGIIDDMHVYDYIRTPAQIAWSYNRGQPIGWWKLDECSGTTANDSSGKGNSGTILAGSGPNDSVGTCSSGAGDEMWDNGTTGKLGASLDFDGSDDHVTIGTELFEYQDFSVAAWVKVADTSSTGSLPGIVENTDRPDGNAGWLLAYSESGNNFEFYVDDIGNGGDWDIAETSTINYDQWYHIVAVSDNGTVKIFLNGAEQAISDTHNPIVYTGTTYAQIGSYVENSHHFNGQIDEVKIFNYALTPEQIRENYNAGAVRFD
jgi:hypothetical protein